MKPLSKQEMVDAMTTNIDAMINLLNKLVNRTSKKKVKKLYLDYLLEGQEEMYSGYLKSDHEVMLVYLGGHEWIVDVRKRAENDDDPDETIEGHMFSVEQYETAKTLYVELVNKYDDRTDLASHANAYS